MIFSNQGTNFIAVSYVVYMPAAQSHSFQLFPFSFWVEHGENSRIMFTVGNVDRDIDRYIGRHSIDMAVDSRSIVERQSID